MHWNKNIREKFIYEKKTVAQDEIKIQESSINQKSNNVISVKLCTRATFVSKYTA